MKQLHPKRLNLNTFSTCYFYLPSKSELTLDFDKLAPKYVVLDSKYSLSQTQMLEMSLNY